MNELDVKLWLACIFKFHADVKSETVILDGNPLKVQLSRKLNFHHLCRVLGWGGVSGVHKR